MAGGAFYETLVVCDEFLETFGSKDFKDTDRKQFRKALRLLDHNESHPSLRVHELEGPLKGVVHVSIGRVRMTFVRPTGDKKAMLTCSRHYDR